jgi:iron complex outermembrane receptor protein
LRQEIEEGAGMGEQSRLFHGAARGLILFLLVTNLCSPAHGQTSSGSDQWTTSSSSQAAAANQGGLDAGSLDKLLDLAEKDVGQLSNVNVAGHTGSPALDQPVSTVERQASTVGKTPAAVFVITNEMIRRSGAQTVPEVLRMVPGVDVAQISANTWAVSVRGFNSLFANKLLVQIDGRTVYDLTSGGVFWDVQQLILEDVERIEVIRGPGATVWGSNAVNGVINILTKKAQDTQGVFMQGGSGTQELGYTNARTGGRIGQDLYYRVYGQWFERNHSPDGSISTNDAWRQEHGGFRMDYDASRSDAMVLEGDYYNGYSGLTSTYALPTPPYSGSDNVDHVSGEYILYSWKHTKDEDSDWTFQTYYNRIQRHALKVPIDFTCDRDLADMDFQHRFPLGTRNEIIWGCGYRFTQDSFPPPSFQVSYDPQQRFDNYFTYFLQDQITLVENRWFFIAGSKFEHNPYTNFEYQPTARLLWTPDDRHSIWGAISRAVHVPVRFVDNGEFKSPVSSSPLPIFVDLLPDPGALSEDLLAYEFGIRVQATKKFSWDLAMFYNQYTNLETAQSGTPYLVPAVGPPDYIILPINHQFTGWGETYGAELATNYAINESWRMQLAYTYLRMFLRNNSTAPLVMQPGESPCNEVYLQSSWNLGDHWEFDLTGRYVDILSGGIVPDAVPSYITMDTRLAWHKNKNLEVAVVGRNLGRGYFTEFLQGTLVGPEVYGQVTWRY